MVSKVGKILVVDDNAGIRSALKILLPMYFMGGALLVLTIVLGVVVLNCLHIARSNPVDSLKNE